MERDRYLFETVKEWRISTHTLTWSVTDVLLSRALGGLNFNSHAHVERDRFVDRKSARTCHFNSHAHVERDVLIFAEYLKENISTHTLTWSVTRSSLAT